MFMAALSAALVSLTAMGYKPNRQGTELLKQPLVSLFMAYGAAFAATQDVKMSMYASVVLIAVYVLYLDDLKKIIE